MGEKHGKMIYFYKSCNLLFYKKNKHLKKDTLCIDKQQSTFVFLGS